MASTAAPERILEHLASREDEILDLCGELVSIESPSPDPAATRQVLERLTTELDELGYRYRMSKPNQSGGYLYARPARRCRHHPTQLVVGHVDTVWPIGTLETRPWKVEDDIARGPGVFDMKAGVVQILFALRSLRDLGLQPTATPVVLFNSDEEIGSRESTPVIDRLSRVASRAFICEPGLGSSGAMKTARKGLAKYTVTVHGRAAHAGLDPEAGASAILELSSVIQRLFALTDRERDITVNVGTIEGGIQANVVAPRSQAVVDVRVLTPEDATDIDAAIRAIEPVTPGTSITVAGGFGRPPMVRSERNRLLFERARRIGTRLGMDLREVTAGGGSDGNTTSQRTATLDGLGIVGDGAHAPSERIDLKSLAPRTALLAALLMEPIDGEAGGTP
jgi:glutamate carboxypeptidase